MLKRLVLLSVGSFFFLSLGTAHAANFTVNHNGDTSDAAAGNGLCADAIGNCTLRAAVEEANALSGDDAIFFAASLLNATITLTTGVEITINGTGGALQIRGLGADKLTIDGGAGSNRIFVTTNAAAFAVTGVTMQGGGAIGAGSDGGAIFAGGGTLELYGVVVRNNSAGTNNGGGIYLSSGTNHRILNSTVANNSAANGGGFYLNGGTLFMANSTVSGNTITGQAGGILLVNSAATFRNSTITNNTANNAGGGIQVANTAFNVGNCIIAGNTSPNYPEILHFDTITSAGNNFIGDSPGDSTSTNAPVTYQPSDIRDQNPLLGSLQNNGGQTPTHALSMTSLAVNAGDTAKAVNPYNNSPLSSDQRGFAPRTIGGTVDIGAFEFNAAPTAASVSIGGRVLTASGNAIGRAQVTLTGPHGETHFNLTNPFGYYRFDDVTVGETCVLTIVSKTYSFTPQVVSVAGDLTELNFVAEP